MILFCCHNLKYSPKLEDIAIFFLEGGPKSGAAMATLVAPMAPALVSSNMQQPFVIQSNLIV